MFLQDSVYLSLRLETFMSKITFIGLYLYIGSLSWLHKPHMKQTSGWVAPMFSEVGYGQMFSNIYMN